jgi:hypothetical protein
LNALNSFIPTINYYRLLKKHWDLGKFNSLWLIISCSVYLIIRRKKFTFVKNKCCIKNVYFHKPVFFPVRGFLWFITNCDTFRYRIKSQKPIFYIWRDTTILCWLNWQLMLNISYNIEDSVTEYNLTLWYNITNGKNGLKFHNQNNWDSFTSSFWPVGVLFKFGKFSVSYLFINWDKTRYDAWKIPITKSWLRHRSKFTETHIKFVVNVTSRIAILEHFKLFNRTKRFIAIASLGISHIAQSTIFKSESSLISYLRRRS